MAFTIYEPRQGPAVRGVLFDMDGLVLDTEKLYARFWAEAARDFGFPMTYEQALGMRALCSQAGAEKLRSYFGPTVDYVQVRTRRIERMDAYVAENGVEPKPGIRELLDYLHEKGIGAALASSSPMERIENYLGQLGLLRGFDVLCSGREVEHGKPNPDIFILAAHRLGLEPESCMVLEDSPSGLLAGYRAGCYPVMIPDLDQPNGETLPLLYAKADSLSDVIGLLEGMR